MRPGSPAFSVTGDDGDKTAYQERDDPRCDALDAIDDAVLLNHGGERHAGETRFIDITIDSGAAEFVAPSGFTQAYPIKPSTGWMTGAKCRTASGTSSATRTDAGDTVLDDDDAYTQRKETCRNPQEGLRLRPANAGGGPSRRRPDDRSRRHNQEDDCIGRVGVHPAGKFRPNASPVDTRLRPAPWHAGGETCISVRPMTGNGGCRPISHGHTVAGARGRGKEKAGVSHPRERRVMCAPLRQPW